MLDLPSLPPRVMPCLLLQDDVFVKTKKFKNPVYIGDPVNTINLFNKFEVDEIILLDIGCARSDIRPNFSLISDLATQCWSPLSYGGGIRSILEAKKIMNSGVEKIIFDSLIFSNPQEVKNCVQEFGASSVVGCINVRQSMFGNYQVFTNAGRKKIKLPLSEIIKQIKEIGLGEFVINNISRDGTRFGYDTNLIKVISEQVYIPVIAIGGAKNLEDFKIAIDNGASGVAAGSYFVFQKNEDSGVLVNYPDRKLLEGLFYA